MSRVSKVIFSFFSEVRLSYSWVYYIPFKKVTPKEVKREKALIMMKDLKSLGTSGGTGLEMLKTSVAVEKNATHS